MERPSQGSRRQTVVLVGGIFALALGLRWLFWQATPDASSAYSAYYKGDAPYWLAYAGSLQKSVPFELGLPLRPPGIPYLLALLWDGNPAGFPILRFAWCLLGAVTVSLMFLVVRRSFGLGVGLAAGLFMSASTGLMLLSTSLNNETPYLFLIAACFALWERTRVQPGRLCLLLWAVLNGLACLIRVEHVLFFFMVSVYLALVWAGLNRASGWKASLSRTLWIWLCFGLVLTPWHLKAWSDIQHFNREPLPMNPATEQAVRQVETSLSHLTWQDGALEERAKLPAFVGRTAANFVAATVAARGGTEVSAADFRILEEAFGYRPEPVDAHPFIVLYGGLNFLLANNADSTGGFNLAPLEKPPPLRGGVSRYPPNLITGLPPRQLTLAYPPHLQALNHGYRLGLAWIRQQPLDFFRLTWNKLNIFWEGASLGLTGYNFPFGLSGTRRAVDLVVPDGSLTGTLWRWTLLLLLCLGLYLGMGRAGLIPWLFFLSYKVLVAFVFFGYAREGATIIPVLSVLTGLALDRLSRRFRTPSQDPQTTWNRWLAGTLIATLILVTVEGVRWKSGPTVTLDGQKTGATDPFSVVDYESRRLVVH